MLEYTPKDLLRKIEELESRLKKVETSASLPNSSVQGGRIEVLDDDGNVVANIGKSASSGRIAIRTIDPNTGESIAAIGQIGIVDINPPGLSEETGFLVEGADGTDVISLTKDRGLLKPALSWSWIKDSQFEVVTSATFIDVWECPVKSMPSTALQVDGTILCPAGTTAEVRMAINATYYTTAVACPAGQTGYNFKIDMVGLGYDLGSDHLIKLQVRRTGGAGNVNAYVPRPTRTWDTKLLGADTDGIYP